MDGLLLSRALARNQVAELGMAPEAVVDGGVVLDRAGRVVDGAAAPTLFEGELGGLAIQLEAEVAAGPDVVQ